MGFVVGKLAKAPDGSRVLFDLTGPLARSIRVSVDGRAQVVDDFGGQEPTATIRLDGSAVHQARRRAPAVPRACPGHRARRGQGRGRADRRAAELRDLTAAGAEA